MDYKDYLAGNSKTNFWFRAKVDLIEILLQKYIENHSKKLKILSLGAGTGEELYSLNKFGEVYVTDIEKKALKLIPKDLYKERKICDACNISYPDEFFELVVAFDVFEHIKDDKNAISEVYRVLKKNGFLIFSVPAFQFIYSSHDKAVEHKRRYSKKDLKSLFKEFKDPYFNYWNFTLFLPLVISRLIKKYYKPKVENPITNPIIDSVLYNILKTENFWFKKKFKTPPGISIFGVCRKP